MDDSHYRQDSTTDVEDGDIDVVKDSDAEDDFNEKDDNGEVWTSSPTQEKLDSGRLDPRGFGADQWEIRSRLNQASVVDEPYRKTPSRASKGARHRSTSRIAFQDNPFGKPWRSGDPYRYNTTMLDKNPWLKCRKLVDKYDKSMCAAWKEEVDKLLIFSGLFSATITAFAVESYKWLREEPEDVSIKILAYLTAQSTNISLQDLERALNLEPFAVSGTEARINALWFMSLAFSVTTVLIGILCLQWLREYERDSTLPFKDAIALRQMRFEGLVSWRVPEILSLLPLLLQISLVLFFFGLLDLLWTHNRPVAACLTVILGIVLLFVVFTIIAPTMQQALSTSPGLRIAQCPYKSPQSWLFYCIFNSVFLAITRLLGLPWKSTSDTSRFYRLLKSVQDTSWLAFDMRWRTLRDASVVIRGAPRDVKDGGDLHDALHWLNSTFTVQNPEAVHPLHACLTSDVISVESAEQAVGRMYLDLGQMDAATFRVMLDDSYSPNQTQKKDVVSAFYLHLHYRGQGSGGGGGGNDGDLDEGNSTRDVALRNAYVEAVVRILNSQDVPRPFLDWMTEILIELCGRVVNVVDVDVAVGIPGLALTGNRLRRSADSRYRRSRMRRRPKRQVLVDEDEELVSQVLMCVRGLIVKDALRVLDMVMAWNLIYYVLYEFSDLPVVAAPLSAAALRQREYLPLVMSIVEVLVGWIENGKERDRWERVKLCAEGVMKVFPPPILQAFKDSATIMTNNAALRDSVVGSLRSGVGYAPEESVHTTKLANGLAIRESIVDDAPRYDGLRHVVELICALDGSMENMGGVKDVLHREKSWHEFWDSGFSEEDWKAVVAAV